MGSSWRVYDNRTCGLHSSEPRVHSILVCLITPSPCPLVGAGQYRVSTQPKEPGGPGPGLSWNFLFLILLSCCQVLPLDLSSLPLILESQRPKPPPASVSPKAVGCCFLSEANTVSLTQFYLPSLSVCLSTHGLSLNMMPKYVLTSTKQNRVATSAIL